nr:hypothetical protein L203_00117 [Cryptococcus depauperatus CBS 7841]
MATLRWAKFTLHCNWGIFKVKWVVPLCLVEAYMLVETVPDEKELYSQLSPELKNKMDQIMRQREGKITTKEKLQEAGNKDEVVWGDQLVAKQKPWLERSPRWLLGPKRSHISSCWILLIWNDFLGRKASHKQHQSLLNKTFSHLSYVPRDLKASDAILKIIYSTDLHTSNKLPNQYQSWTTLNPDWTVLYVEDEMIDSWLADGLKLAENKDSEGPVALKEMLWLKSHWGVIRADLFSPDNSWAQHTRIPLSHFLNNFHSQLSTLAQDPSNALFDTPSSSLIVAIEMEFLPNSQKSRTLNKESYHSNKRGQEGRRGKEAGR